MFLVKQVIFNYKLVWCEWLFHTWNTIKCKFRTNKLFFQKYHLLVIWRWYHCHLELYFIYGLLKRLFYITEHHIFLNNLKWLQKLVYNINYYNNSISIQMYCLFYNSILKITFLYVFLYRMFAIFIILIKNLHLQDRQNCKSGSSVYPFQMKLNVCKYLLPFYY